MSSRIDRTLEANILREYPTWRSMTKTASVCHCSVSCVHKTLHRNNVRVEPRGAQRGDRNSRVVRIPHDELALTRQLYETGYSMNELAEMFNLTHTSIRRRLALTGTQPRDRAESTRLRFQRRPRATPKTGDQP